MEKIWLVVRNTKIDKQYIKYFETEFEKDKYRRKIYHIPYLYIIEDSTDINYGNIEDIEFGEFKYDSQI